MSGLKGGSRCTGDGAYEFRGLLLEEKLDIKESTVQAGRFVSIDLLALGVPVVK